MHALFLVAAAALSAPPPLVPGGCTAPAAEHVGEAGCYLLAELKIEHAPARLYWHISEFSNMHEAETAALKHRWSKIVTAHDRIWLYVMGSKKETITGGISKTIIGPMDVPSGGTASVRFLTSKFPPGMRTRVHSHPGSEAFYVIEGEQCVETPSQKHRISAGNSYIVPSGMHMQAAAKGRLSLVALILRPEQLWSQPEPSWTPSDFCDQ
jgi:quercetin dioxygenase-like cupin family protein